MRASVRWRDTPIASVQADRPVAQSAALTGRYADALLHVLNVLHRHLPAIRTRSQSCCHPPAPCRQKRREHLSAAAASLADACRRRTSTCCAAEASLRTAGSDGSAAAEVQLPVSSAAPAADMDRLHAIRERIKRQRGEQLLSSYSLHATQVGSVSQLLAFHDENSASTVC